MGNLLKVMHWHIENIQALPARFVALAVFSAIAKSNLKNKRAGKSTKLSYFDCDLIENLDKEIYEPMKYFLGQERKRMII